jgi:DNA-directed RNA polymerase subunit RPC12/RpoP
VSAQRVQLLRKSGYQRGVVACRKCGTPIPVQNFSALPDEFSVRCPGCGDRAFYAKRAVAIQDLPERRKKPRR